MTWQPTNQLERERLDKLERLIERGIEPYPGKVQRTHTISAAIAAFEQTASELTAAPVNVTVCGRLRAIRISGKASFADIEDGTGRVQLFVKQDAVGEAAYDLFKRDLDLGDFVQVTGVMMRTRSGEISVQAAELKVLSKALSPLPVVKEQEVDGQVVRYAAFTDQEERYRQRYVDLAVNLESRELFRARARTISAVRRFLDNEGFLEVETPILQPVYGGAAARPFTTHHNQLRQDLYLRISFELYLKRLLVGGYDAVYEIGRDFRNEGVSFKHNPEFTQIEFYKAYIDYTGVMDITERMVSTVAQDVTGSMTVHFRGYEINLAPPWPRRKMRDAIREVTGIDYMHYPTAETLASVMREKGCAVKPGLTWGKMVEELLGQVESHLIQPTFIVDYPRDISPFAKRLPGDELHVERFEFYIGGMEFGNAFTELNDPRDQEQRFLDMAALYGENDDDATPIDEDYLRAMRYGMPPNGGFGMGIDRLTMLLTAHDTIREVLLYPHLRAVKDTEPEPTPGT
ncbi:MAG: lysine--tRNA ligase [Aggregatilineales bacterium]